jgi:hypothetical protein
VLAAEAAGYFNYVPYKSKISPFWKDSFLWWDSAQSWGVLSNLPYDKKDPKSYFAANTPGLYSLCLGNEGTLGPVLEKTSVIRGGESAPLVAGFVPSVCGESATFTDKLYGRSALYCNGNEASGSTCDLKVTNPIDSDGKTKTRNPHMPWYCLERCGRYTGIEFGSTEEFYCSRDREDETTSCGPFFEGVCDRRCRNVCYAPRDGSSPGIDNAVRQCSSIGSTVSNSEALGHAQSAYFTSIVLCQIAGVMICKTRWLSLRSQGMKNNFMNFAIFFEVLLVGWLLYATPINSVLGTRGLRLVHWFPVLPFVAWIFVYDETRKYLMRGSSPKVVDSGTGAVIRYPGWLERFTLY